MIAEKQPDQIYHFCQSFLRAKLLIKAKQTGKRDTRSRRAAPNGEIFWNVTRKLCSCQTWERNLETPFIWGGNIIPGGRLSHKYLIGKFKVVEISWQALHKILKPFLLLHYLSISNQNIERSENRKIKINFQTRNVGLSWTRQHRHSNIFPWDRRFNSLTRGSMLSKNKIENLKRIKSVSKYFQQNSKKCFPPEEVISII